MASSKHTVATYNMSFAGDAGLDPRRAGVFESEGAFHLSNETGNARQFWINALGVVSDFWTNVPDASVMGLQEINKTAVGTATGSAVVESSVKAAVGSRADAFDVSVITEEIVVNPNVRPALMIIWNASKLGKEVKHEISDLDYVPGEEAVEELTKPNGTKAKKSGKQTGRPILMVLTDKGYLLINCHAPNHAELSAKTLADLRAALESKVSTFLGSETVSKDKVFLMGDFNDRYDALQSVSLSVGDLKYKGKAPLSCCHNWDSSCTDERYKPLNIAGREKVGTCDPKGQPLAGPGARTVMGVEGNIENYRYYGDKVFGSMPSTDVDGNIQIYPPGRVGASKESDHEMVIATFVSAAAGGRRRSLRRKTKRNSKSRSRRNNRR
jgi:hypothetical protein